MSRHPDSELAALVDGELDHVARERTLGHLTHCASCRTEVDAQRRIKARLLGLDGQPPSQELSDRLLALGGSLELPGPELPDSELPDSELPDSELPDSESPGPELSGSELPGSELAGPDLGECSSGQRAATRHAAGAEQESPAEAGPALIGPALTGPAGPLFGGGLPIAGRRRPVGAWRPGAAPGGSAGPGRRSRRWQRRTLVSGAFLAIGLGAVLAVGGPRSTPPGRTAVDPASDTFVVDYATTSVELPLPDPAGVSTVGFGK